MELIKIPNGYIVYLINKTTTYFDYLLSFGKSSWLVGFTYKYKYIFLVTTFLTFIIIKKSKTLYKIPLLSLLLLTTLFSLHLCKSCIDHVIEIPMSDGKMILKNDNGILTLVDYGQFNTKGSPQNYVNFELKPYLIKNYGILSVDKLELHKAGVRSFKGAKALHSCLGVKDVSVRLDKKKLSKYAWKCYYDLKLALENANGVSKIR